MIHIRRSQPIIVMAQKPLHGVSEPHRPLQARNVAIFGQEKMTVDHGGFVSSKLGQDIRGYFFGFIVRSVCVVVIPDDPFSIKVSKVTLEAKTGTFWYVDADKFHSAAFRRSSFTEMIP